MSDPLTAIYDAKIAEGSLRPDPAQRLAVAALEDLRLRIAKPEKKALFGIFAKKKPSEGPLGLYMWGGVGRGKSMLMDLFYEALDVPARRVHFHAFMQEVHRAMTAARKNGVEDAILPVAEGIAA